ncbi:hypothetical protein OT109_18465 [Phycisphaeraceae bacterium D3-23]
MHRPMRGRLILPREAMRNTLRDVIPSMFHRRLLLLALVAVGVLCILGFATARLTTGRSYAEARVTSEAKLESTQLISTKRGAILDRNGRILALDEPGWEVAVHFGVITGEWAGREAERDAKKDRLKWEALGDAERDVYVGELRAQNMNVRSRRCSPSSRMYRATAGTGCASVGTTSSTA